MRTIASEGEPNSIIGVVVFCFTRPKKGCACMGWGRGHLNNSSRRAAMFGKSSVVALVLALVPAVSIAQEQIKKGQQANINTYPDCTVVAGNLVNNCGFETGDFTGWTQGGDTS